MKPRESIATAPSGRLTSGAILRSTFVEGIEILSCLHSAGTRLPKHDHENASLEICIRGACREWVGSREFEQRRGGVIFKPAGAHHSNTFEREDHRYVVVGFGPDYPSLPNSVAASTCENIANEAIRIESEISSRLPGWRALVESSVLAILGTLERSNCGSDNGRWLDLAADLALEGRSLSAIAKIVNRSPSNIAKAFRQRFGISVGGFCRRERLFQAAQQIRAGLKLADVAANSGFYDQCHLTRTFRKMFNLTPAEYRRLHVGSLPPESGDSTLPRDRRQLE
jgi:AraC-like DNA-binding protein